jgi:hypothetical protein
MPFPPPVQNTLKIFDGEPAATQTTFSAGIPGTNNQQQSLSIILFSPNLQIIASMDNTNSQATSSYSVEVTTGFTFSTTQSISISSEVGINIEVVCAKITTTYALSFTEQWNSSTTKSMTFTCPPGAMAFVYQGTLMSKVLVFNAETAQYSWSGSASKALTQVILTSSTPIGTVPSNSITFKQV